MATQQFGLFVEGSEEPAVTASDADLLQQLRRAPQFRGARTKVADVKADTSKLFPSTASTPSPAGLEIRRAELRREMTLENTDKELRKQIEGEDLGPDKEVMKELREPSEAPAPEVVETSKIEAPHTAEGNVAATLPEADAEAKKSGKSK